MHMLNEDETSINRSGDSETAPEASTFSLDRLERNQLYPGFRIDHLGSRVAIDGFISNIKKALILDQPQPYGLDDRTSIRRPQSIFDAIRQAIRPEESADVVDASAIILTPWGTQQKLTDGGTRRNFTLHDIVHMGLVVEHMIQYMDESNITLTTYSEYIFYVATVLRSGVTRKTRYDTLDVLELIENHLNLRRVMQTIRDARPFQKALSPSEIDELNWKQKRIREDRLEQLRREQMTRYLTFPPDWEKREQALEGRNRYHINHPASGGLPSLGKNSH